jgi:hypothetical protein
LELGLQFGKVFRTFWEGDREVWRGSDATKLGGDVMDDGLPSVIHLWLPEIPRFVIPDHSV